MSGDIPSILGVHACGSIYGEAGCDFDLFRKENISNHEKPHRVSVIFGHNGSGKTTIARQIASAAKRDSGSYFYDGDNAKLELDLAEAERVRVFDESYIESKIRIKDDGLQAIVMLGDQADAEAKIAEINEKLETDEEEIAELENRKKALESGPSSVDQLRADAMDDAKNGGWGQRGQDVKRLKSKMVLNANRWSSILQASTTSSRNEVDERYRTKLAGYRKAQASGSLIDTRLEPIMYTHDDEEKLIRILGRVLDESELTDRERRILSLVQNGRQDMVEMARVEFASGEATVCPLCQQEVSKEYGESLERSIVKILGKEVDEYKTELRAIALPDIQEAEIPQQVSGDAKAAYASACSKAGSSVEGYRELIRKRETNLYTPLDEIPHGLADAIDLLNDSIVSVNGEIDTINEAFRNRERMEQELLELSDQIAWIDAHAKIELHAKAEKELADVNNRLSEQQSLKKSHQSDKRQQEARLCQVDIAADIINRYLASVYFDVNRFRLVPSDERYAIRSHGNPVMPKDISTGERNILALCYFFSEGGENKREGSEDNDPQYIVLDDPVSSFDMENRIGICSLIRERAEHLIGSNPDSRITVLTHDAGVVTELEHTFEDIKISTGKTFIIDYLDLARDGTRDRPMKIAEYTALLKRAYDFASSQTEDERETQVIGNVLRRILEGYGTFNYGMGMEEISRNPELSARFGDLAPLLGSVMYRLAFNDESHMRERLSALNTPLNFSRYSYDEKKACAQCVFVILDKLDHEHVRHQLKKSNVSDKDIGNKLACWESRFTAVENS